jgi:hypothetical protein
VIFNTNIQDFTIKSYDTSKLHIKAICISSIDDRTKERLWYLTKDIIKNLSYTDFDIFRNDKKNVIISMLYDPETTKTEVYCTGIIKNKLCNPNNSYLQRQLSIANDYFRKDVLASKDKYDVC